MDQADVICSKSRSNRITENGETVINRKLAKLIDKKNIETLQFSSNSLERLGGSLAVHCHADLKQRRVTDVAAMTTLYRGYEALLPGKELNQVGRVSSIASGICGGVHATASALCLEMALGISPPPLGVVLRNLLLSCQYLNDNTMHLFILAGPDYSQQIIELTNPELWQKAKNCRCKFHHAHRYNTVSDIMFDLNKRDGKLYRQALQMVSVARQAYTLLGGKYPHSESIIPGGVSLSIDNEKLLEFRNLLSPFVNYSKKVAAIWDEIFDFFYSCNPSYQVLGQAPATMLDFGQWDHHEYYDASYENCNNWGAKRWSTPAIVINGKLVCDQLAELNAGIEESLNYSYQQLQTKPNELILQDPLGNPISEFHPWNKYTCQPTNLNPHAYSWGSSLTWQGHTFEVGAYARLYLTAIAQKVPDTRYLDSTGSSLDFYLPDGGKTHTMQWSIPEIWNTFERNRARAYSLAFNLAITLQNIDIADQLISRGETRCCNPDGYQRKSGLGVGLWGASRGFLAHWSVVENQKIHNYQLSIPSRVNVGTRSANGDAGPLEAALINTPILETGFKNIDEFSAIDLQRTIQSFDPCMSCTAHILVDEADIALEVEIDTSFPI